MSIDLWLFPTDANVVPREPATLSPEELARGNRLVDPQRRERFFATREIGRRIFSRSLNCEPSEINWPATGAPLIRSTNGRELSVSLSHTGQVALLAVSTEQLPLGVDIEQFTPSLRFQSVMAAAFTPAERAFIGRHPATDQEAVFRRMWVLKEAVWKSLRGGLPTVAQIELLPSLDSSGRSNWIVVQHTETCTVQCSDFILSEFELPGPRLPLPQIDLQHPLTGAWVAAGDISPVASWSLSQADSSELTQLRLPQTTTLLHATCAVLTAPD